MKSAAPVIRCCAKRSTGNHAKSSRPLKKTHMLRCRSIASLQRTVSTPPLVDISRASHLDLFEQPAGGFFQHPTRDCRSFFRWFGIRKNSGLRVGVEPDARPTGPQPMATGLAHAPVAASQNDRARSRDSPVPGLA